MSYQISYRGRRSKCTAGHHQGAHEMMLASLRCSHVHHHYILSMVYANVSNYFKAVQHVTQDRSEQSSHSSQPSLLPPVKHKKPFVLCLQCIMVSAYIWSTTGLGGVSCLFHVLPLERHRSRIYWSHMFGFRKCLCSIRPTGAGR